MMMKKILVAFLVTAAVCSCYRKPLYLGEPVETDISVSANMSIETIWDTDWKTNLRYEWDEELYGPIGYRSDFDYITGDFYRITSGDREFSLSEQFKMNELTKINVTLGRTYDALFYSELNNNIHSDSPGNEYFRVETQAAGSKVVKFDIDYPLMEQPDELFSEMKDKLLISPESGHYKKVERDGKIIGVYNIDVTIVPVTYIYIFQFVFVDDDKSIPFITKDVTGLTINGLARSKDLFTGKTFTDKAKIFTSDIKPGQWEGDSLRFVSRILTYGLPSDIAEGSSWSEQDDSKCQLGIELRTVSGEIRQGAVDITQIMRKKNKGGVITIVLKNSTINTDPSEGGGFDINIGEWDDIETDIIL